jgi:hypothetical protein
VRKRLRHKPATGPDQPIKTPFERSVAEFILGGFCHILVLAAIERGTIEAMKLRTVALALTLAFGLTGAVEAKQKSHRVKVQKRKAFKYKPRKVKPRKIA